VPHAIPDPSLTSPCSPPSSYFHHIQPPPPSQLFCQTNAGNYITESISSWRGSQVRWAIFVISKKEEKRRKPTRMAVHLLTSILSKTNPHPHPSTIYNIPIEKKPHIAYIDNLKQRLRTRHGWTILTSGCVFDFLHTVLSKFEIPPKKAKSNKKKQVRADDEQRVTMYLVVGMIYRGIFGQPGAGDRVGWWWVCSSFVDERGVVYVHSKTFSTPKPPSVEYVSLVFFLYHRCHGSVVEWLLKEKRVGNVGLGEMGHLKISKPVDWIYIDNPFYTLKPSRNVYRFSSINQPLSRFTAHNHVCECISYRECDSSKR